MKLSPKPLSQSRELLLILAPAIAVVLGGFWLAFQFVEPAPPSVVRISTGSSGGGYYSFARRYEEILGQSGIRLEVLTSAGSVENLKRLEDPDGDIDLAMMQGGVLTSAKSKSEAEAGPDQEPAVVSLGRIFPEPLWIFYPEPQTLTTLGELKGRRLAIGPEGSGTRILAEALLQPNGITAANTEMIPLGGTDAGEALKAGEVDAILLTLSPKAPLIG
ncbi:MAG: TAXI family TRAP transporter solute-binding subunit, partial [Pseudomonadota bacterium]